MLLGDGVKDIHVITAGLKLAERGEFVRSKMYKAHHMDKLNKRYSAAKVMVAAVVVIV